MKTVLLTGSNGFVGAQIAQKIGVENINLVCFSKGINRLPQSLHCIYNDIDFLDLDLLNDCLYHYKPDIIIHCAALSQVDKCENNPKYCNSINVKATETLVKFSESCGAHFVFFSSDFVFDGSKKLISKEEIPNPISVYGESKLRAEQIVQYSNVQWSIIRPVLVYGFSETAARSNIFTWIYKSLKNNVQIQVVKDQIRTPTFVQDVVDLTQLIINNRLTGFFNIGGADIVSVSDFAIKVSQLCGFDQGLIEIQESEAISGGVLRPKNSCFNNDRIISEFNLNPMGLDEGIRNAIAQIELNH